MRKNRMFQFEIFIGTWHTIGEMLQTAEAPAITLLAKEAQ